MERPPKSDRSACDASAIALARLDPDRLDVEIFLQVLLAGFPAVAAHLVAAKGHCGVHRLIAIDPDRARAQRPRDMVRLGDVARPNARTKAEGGGIGAADQFVSVLKGDRGDHRAKN